MHRRSQTIKESTGDAELGSSLSPAQKKFLKMQQVLHQKTKEKMILESVVLQILLPADLELFRYL